MGVSSFLSIHSLTGTKDSTCISIRFPPHAMDDEQLIGGMGMEKRDRDRGRTHLDPLEQATEEAKDADLLDHEEGIRDPERLPYSEQLKRL